MNRHHLQQAIHDCNNGVVPFNMGLSRAFLYGNKWYPLRGVVNYAQQLAGEEELTTDRALVAYVYLGYYARISDVNFENNFPVILNSNEKMAEAHSISEMLEMLVRP